MKPASRIALPIALVLIASLASTCATVTVAPAGARVTAPLVCPSDTARSVVVTRWRGNAKGGRSLDLELYCLDAHGHGTVPSGAKVVVALLGMWGALVGALVLGWRGLGRLAARGRRAREAGAGGRDAA